MKANERITRPRGRGLAWLGLLCALAACTPRPVERQAAVALYQERCATCHEGGVERTPTRESLAALAPEDIAAALTDGSMRPQAQGLNAEEIRAVALYLSGKPFGTPQAAAGQGNRCARAAPPLALAESDWNGWGRDLDNSRYHPEPGLPAADVPRLKLKWAYAYPGRSAFGQPTVVGDRLYVTSASGRVSALDPRSGCEYWSYEAGVGVKSAVVVGALGAGETARFAAFFGDQRATVHAVDAQTGAPLWKTRIDTHPMARVTGSPIYHQGRVYFPLSSHEEGAAGNPRYPCCTFRGSVVSLDAASGDIVWKTTSIAEEPRPFRKSSTGTQLYGPAGGAIWSAPSIDPRRGLVYAATGNSYTNVPTDGADAVVAFDLATGTRRWARQLTPNDNFVLRCSRRNAGQGNCPDRPGPDFDFGSPPLLRTLADGRQILLASQKSGIVYALDPDAAGKVLWSVQVGRGSALGGIQFGPAADTEHVYVAISDIAAFPSGLPGLTALRLSNGEKLWYTPTPEVSCAWGRRGCGRAQSAAVSVIPGIAFSGAMDGHIRAYSTRDGAIVWDFDTAKSFDTVNGVRAEGGSIDGGGATLSDGVLYVNSGYGTFGKAGRLLLAFSVDAK